MKKKLLIIIALLLTLVQPIQAQEFLSSEEIQTIVYEQVEKYANSIKKSDSGSDATLALATHGAFGRGKKLSVNSSHALASTLMNANLVKDGLSKILTENIMVMSNLNEDKLFVEGYFVWDTYEYNFRSHLSGFYDTNYNRNDLLIRPTQYFSKIKFNEYDNTCEWIVGNGCYDMELIRKSTTKDYETYNVKLIIYDRFDFRGNNGSIAKDVASLLASPFFKPFDWESTLNFQIKIPTKACNHKSNNFAFEYDKISNELASIQDKEFTSNNSLVLNENQNSSHLLEKAIYLNHDRPWVLEITSKGLNNLELRTAHWVLKDYPSIVIENNFVAIKKEEWNPKLYAKDNLYGIELEKKTNNNHEYTYRFENVIENKNNMIYLTIVDKTAEEVIVEHVPLNHYYISIEHGLKKENQKKVVNGVNGLDFIINHIGDKDKTMDVEEFTLKVWENGKSYTTDKVVQPTCTSKGYTEHKCKHCGVTYKDTYTSKLSHVFADYVSNGDGTGTSKCNNCDETHTILYGDVNNDQDVNSKDRMQLARNLARWDGYEINPLTSDVNCDGKVNSEDRMILARHLARWQGYETLPYIK